LAVGAPLAEVQAGIWEAYMEAWAVEDERGTMRDPSLPFLIRGALAAREVELTHEQAEEWWRTTWGPVTSFGVALYPDVLDVLRELKEMGITVGVNSNRPCTTDMLWPDLADIGLAPYVDAAVCSGDTGYVKPHPSTFTLIVERMGLPAAAVAFVGDDCARDMRGAKALGMTTVWKLNGRYGLPPCPDADFAIHDLGELLALPIIHRSPRPLVSTESLTPHEDANEDRY
jgi:HAD superfamily hydrolase (TIGR01509 family)